MPKGQRRYFNREWSWLRFNGRVLEESEDSKLPLLERLKFVSIFDSNLDEFFMIRVASLYRQLEAGLEKSGIDRRSPGEQLDGIVDRVRRLCSRRDKVLKSLFQDLAKEGVHIVGTESLNRAGRSFVEKYYEDVLYPVITPMIVGPKHPLPELQNATLYIAVSLKRLIRSRTRRVGSEPVGFVAVPSVLPRFLRVPTTPGEYVLVPLESILVTYLERIFSGYEVSVVSAVRVSRDADFVLDEAAVDDMRRAMAKKLLGLRHSAAVRLEHGVRLPRRVKQILADALELDADQFFRQRSMMQAKDLIQVYGTVDLPKIKQRSIKQIDLLASRKTNVFDWVRERPRLVYHPYHSFAPVLALVKQAARDPKVLAIKQTLYRTSGDASPLVQALSQAAEEGKQVTVVVELRARFDEKRNIEWARRLESAGVHVVYGLVGIKTHSKALLIVRHEQHGIRRYLHLGTGNYNDATAKIYTDFGLFTCDEDLGHDISAMFNVLTGATEPPPWRKVGVAPRGFRRRFVELIRREAELGSKGRMVIKCNSLEDRRVIEALYEASSEGVQIDLIVRGICCLRPGVRGLSETIRVRSIVGRFLEHARVYWFHNNGSSETYLSSADWMTRNFDRRVELMFPIEDRKHRAFIEKVLRLQLRDNVRARRLRSNGSYVAVSGAEPPVDSQLATFDVATTHEAHRETEPLRRYFGRVSSKRG